MSEEPGEEPKRPVPLSPNARRVLGVLVEKAKTTPDNYPLTLASLISGCNQKSNRDPKMDLDDEDALLALDELRGLGASLEVQGSGRATKYRHAAYEWLGVESAGAAVMTELMLRGPQTIGEIRTRASRMYAISDLDAAKAVIKELLDKDLVQAVSPPGRGQVFAHKLYPPDEQQYLQAKVEKRAAVSTAAPKKSQTKVDQLLARLETVSDRIDQLENRIKELES
ncbi:YceH family protein [Planctomycetes bacterium K23_9]|uniref:Uncharacterized protein n=1 Tax=Stieleria marina TaxID=1930275 RepID=A0A517P3H9_9BACT|nr:hypothetical protein K239x_59500 [Planctomycetes bacterium K23_9]